MTTLDRHRHDGLRRNRPGLRGAIARHPMTSFFVAAFTLSWAAWTPYVLSGNGLGVLPFRFPELLGTPQLVGVLPGAFLGPIGSAFLVTAIADGRPGLRLWVGRLWRWRVSWRWYVGVILGVPAALILAGIALAGGLEGVQVPPLEILLAYLPMLVLQMLTTGLSEEPGWRDFALPRLQPRFGPLGGTLLLGVLWGCWHLPLFLSDWGGWPDVDVLTVVGFVAAATAFSIVLTWVFNSTGESLPMAVIAHSGVNAFSTLMWSSVFVGSTSHGDTAMALLVASTAVAVVLIIATRGRLGYRGHHQHDQQAGEVTRGWSGPG
jgi:membrane protease YdiL (CAAX protease family)